jgi:uncharacterized protein (TIGR00730 family)
MISICVFCGARVGAQPAYAEAAADLGRLIARRGWRLVFGAGDVGLMGQVSRSASEGGATSLGIIPVHLLGLEARDRNAQTMVVTEDMHERKKVMFMNSDVIAVLPGGAGSLDEFFEVLTWAQIGLHRKPIFLVNVDGYWQPLLALLDHVIAQGFADPSLLGHFRAVPDIAALEAALTPPPV